MPSTSNSPGGREFRHGASSTPRVVGASRATNGHLVTAASLDDLAHHGQRFQDIVVACGVFDGLHRGHRCILDQLFGLATQFAAVPAVITFDPHPRAVLQADNPPRLLTLKAQKLELLHRAGVEAVVLLPFSREMAALSPTDFLHRHLLSSEARVRGICVGANWRFGTRGAGGTAFLRAAGERLGFAVATVPELTYYGRPVSSTRIRDALAAGRLRHAERLLGRRYAVRGQVIHGKGMGHGTFDCPTANVADAQILLPRAGVYAARARLGADQATAAWREGVVYIGTAPTVRDKQAATRDMPILELHLFDFSADIYGQAVEVEFVEFLRPDRRFPSSEALRAQIGADIAAARRVLAAGGAP